MDAPLITSVLSVQVPKIGQLVEVRGRQRPVADFLPSALLPDALAGESNRQHLLTLSSVEDDGLDQQHRGVWEAEVGRRIREPQLALGYFQ